MNGAIISRARQLMGCVRGGWQKDSHHEAAALSRTLYMRSAFIIRDNEVGSSSNNRVGSYPRMDDKIGWL